MYFVFIIIDQDSRPTGETSRGKAKIDEKDKHVAADDTDSTNAAIDIINAHNLLFFNLFTFLLSIGLLAVVVKINL